MLQAVLFDMDGLMIDSEHLQSRAFEAVLRHHGAKPALSEQGIVQIVGMRGKDNYQRLRDEYDLEPSVDELLARHRAIYREILAAELAAMPGLTRLLEDLAKNSVKMAVASSASRKNIETVLDRLEIVHHFQAVVAADELERGKPHPDVFLVAAEKLGANPADCVVLEDAPSGVEAANRAGMKVVAVPNRFTAHHDFATADLVVLSLEALDYDRLYRAGA